MRRDRRIAAGGAIAVLLCAANARAGVTPAQICEAGKNATAGKYAACLQTAQQKFVSGGGSNLSGYDAAVLACGSKYSSKWESIETKAAGLCPSSGDAPGIQAFLESCLYSAEAELAGGALPIDVTTCNTSLGICTADLATTNADLGNCNADLVTCQAQSVCGNAVVEPGENCEAGNLNGKTCVTQGFAGGTLGCLAGCTFDTSNCYSTRFDASGTTIIDHQTGLEWEKKGGVGGGANLTNPHDVDNTYAWSTSGVIADGPAFVLFLPQLNGGVSPTSAGPTTGCYAGHCDWRLPTIEELQTIPYPPNAAFVPDGLTNYWSASAVTGAPTAAWYRNTGVIFAGTAGKGSSGLLRAVRRAGA